MAINKRSKVKAEFNMASLTDIIFLLLIFFMLTSSLVIPNALNLQLPSSSSASASSSQVNTISIMNNGTIRYNSNTVNIESLNNQLRQLAKSQGENASVKIAPDKRTPTHFVIQVMEAARVNGINTILDTPDR